MTPARPDMMEDRLIVALDVPSIAEARALVERIGDAVPLANRLAAEHVELAVDDPDALFAGLRHAGSVFLGRTTPDAGPDDGSDAVEVELNVAEQRAWISCLNDIRLVLGEQLGLTQGTPRETARQGLAEVYDWLTALQHHLVAEIDPLGADDPGSAGEGT